MLEQRKAPRIDVTLPVRWEGVLEQQEATIISLSADGCFVLSGGDVTLGELIRFEIDLPGQQRVYCWGEVTDRARDIGFAVSFAALEDAVLDRLTEFIEQSRSA